MSLYNYDFETVFETAFQTLFSQQGINAAPTLTGAQLETPRVDVKFETGAELATMTPVPGSEGIGMDWDGTLTLSIVTDLDRNSPSHSVYRATIRALLAETPGSVWADLLGASHQLLEITHVSTLYDVLDGEKGLDASVMTYRLKFRLVPAA